MINISAHAAHYIEDNWIHLHLVTLMVIAANIRAVCGNHQMSYAGDML